MTKSLDISFDTSELLNNAEKLVDEVEKKIFKVSCDITNFQLEDDSCLDGCELYIRDIVNTKFKEINRDKLSANNNYWYYENHIKCQPHNYELHKINESTFRNDVIKKSSRDIQISHEHTKNDSKNVKLPQPKKYFKKGNLHTIDVLTRSSQSAVMPSLKLDILPNETNIVSENNDDIPELIINSCKRKKTKNENSIDTAVQTSFQELLNDKPPALLDKSSEFFIAKNISSSSLPSCKIKSAINTDKSNHKEISQNNFDQQVLNDNTKSKRSFIEFICQIAELEINNSSKVKSGDFIKENQNDFNNNKSSNIEIINNDLNWNKIKLNSREYKDVDERLNNLDIKIKNIMENTNKLDDQFRCYNNRNHIDFKINSKSNKRDNNNFGGVKISFKPRSRISSSEITSEIFKSPERFSTPLNNCNYIDIPVNVDTKNTCNDVEELSTSITKFDVNNDSKVFITRNKFSLPTTNENSDEIIIDDKSKIDFCLLETQKEINNKIHSDKDNDLSKNYTVKKLYCEQDAENDHFSFNSSNMNNKNMSGNNEKKEFRSKKSSISNEKKLLESVRSQENIKNNNERIDKNEGSGNFEKNNLTVESSKDDLRDRTSFDVSAIYSESFEAASLTEVESTLKEHKEINGGKIENFQLHKKDDTELQANVLINREENTIHENTIVEDSKDELENREIITVDIKSNSVSENTKEKNNINQSKNSNSSIQSLKKNENRKEYSSIYSLPSSCRQMQKNTPSVQTSTKEKAKSSTNDCSEGEFYLPISYSLGEITVTASNSQENLNYNQNLTDGITDILNFQSFVTNIIRVGQEMSYTENQQ